MWQPYGGVMALSCCLATSTAPIWKRLSVTWPPSTQRREYHAAPYDGRNRDYTGDEYGGIITFPFPTAALCRIVVHNKLIALAEAIFGTEDIRIYAAELWAKYGGAARYEQEHHRDYLNHTPLVPSAGDWRWRGLEMFVWLSDVPEDHGPTHLVPLPVTAEYPPCPTVTCDPSGRISTPANSLGRPGQHRRGLQHRHLSPGHRVTAPRSARYSAHVSYRHADNYWTGRHAWGDRSFHPDWNPFAEQATLRQLLLFGFPPPGHPYWTPETIKELRVRYPRLDTGQWQPRP